MSLVPERFANLSPLQRAVLALQEVQAKLQAVERARTEPIAIVGIGCRIPGGAADPDSFWRLLRDGVSIVKEVPADRWDVDGLYDPDPDAPGKISTKWGGYLDEVDTFDPAFFGIAPREATTMDPQQRLLLEVSWEALEHAGIAADRLSGSRTGVFVGIAGHDYAELLRDSSREGIDAYHASGIAHSIASGRLSYILGLQGPSISIDTACSSSLVAVHLASQSLRVGECRMALAAGVNLILTPGNSITFSKSHMLAPDGRCKTFDAAADGFARAEGCGVLVLKRLSDALADGDRICALIRGTAANQDGPSSGLTAPNGPAQEAVIRDALANAGVRPAQVDYVEAHGTGTPLGDPIEVQALGAAFGTDRNPDQKVIVGSLKTNVGHLEAAAGVAGLIKVVLSLQHEAIPAHLHLQTLNPHIAWDELPVTVPTTLTPWPRGEKPRFAGVSSFGFSGTNVHVVLQEAPLAAAPAGAERPAHVLTISARTEHALRTRARDLRGIVGAEGVSVSGIVHTANAGRAHFPQRMAICGSSAAELASGLDEYLDGRESSRVRTGDATGVQRPKVAFLFTGQGAQYAGMGRQLYASHPVFRQTIDRCDEILAPLLEHRLTTVLYGDRTSLLDETAYTQPALFSIEYALATLWRAWGLEPSAVLGHSIGEYVAACVAGVLTLEDALTLVAARGRLMQGLPRNGGMAVVMADEACVRACLDGLASQLSVAAVNGPANVVISGESDALADVIAELAAQGIKAKALKVSHAFHSALMDPILDEFEAIAATVQFSAPRLRVISNLTGRAASAAELALPRYWREHIRQTVRFADGVGSLVDSGIKLVVEAGPSPTLIGMATACTGATDVAWIPSLRPGQDDWRQITDGLASAYVRGADIAWAGFDQGFATGGVTLPAYPFERRRFWVEPSVRPRLASGGVRDSGLLGRRLQSPSLTDVVFESEIDRSIRAYLYDHRVHGTPIVPATGFVEMALSAAVSIYGGSDAPAISSLVIHEALVLPEEGSVITQVIVEAEAQGMRPFRIYSRTADRSVDHDEACRWKLHVEGRLSPATSAIAAVDATSLSDCSAACSRPFAVEEFYLALGRRGLDFGPAFRGLTALHVGTQEALVRADLPAGLSRGGAAFIHPVLLDNALQAVGVALMGTDGTDADTYLPIAIDHCSVRPGLHGHLWSHVRIERSAGGSILRADLRLFDGEGQPAGGIEGLQLKRADRAAMLRLKTRDVSDWLYDVEWEPRTTAATVSPVSWIPGLGEIGDISNHDVERIAIAADLPAYDAVHPELEALSVSYILAALQALGWAPQTGQRIDAATLGGTLRIAPQRARLFARLLQILEEDGFLARQGTGWDVLEIPRVTDVPAAHHALAHHAALCDAELTLLGRCGSNLAAVLRGEADPLALLFPGGSAETAEKLYQESATARAFNGLIAEAFEKVFSRRPAGQHVSVLEIGGGTGATTSYVLPRLPHDDVDYVFTDVSPKFVARAADKFRTFPNLRCRTLDIERRPGSQGFDGQPFDIIIAANVLHATTDLRTTFAHVRELLAPGGLLVMLEVTRPQRWIDLTFGMTDGWWKFTDTDLRGDYLLLPESGWVTFLRDAGFSEAAAVPASPGISAAFGLQSVLLARNGSAAARAADGRRWVILADEGGTGAALADEIEARGGQVVVVRPGTDAAGVAAGLEGAGSAGRVDGVVSLVALDEPDTAAGSVDEVSLAVEGACAGALRLIQTMATGPCASSKLVFVTRGAQGGGGLAAPTSAPQAALWGLASVAALEHPELRCVRIDLDPSVPTTVAADLADAIALEDGEDRMALRAGRSWVARLVRRSRTAAEGAGAAPYRLDTRERGTLDNLTFYPAERRTPQRGEVEIEVSLSALNFKDVMNALGLYPGDPGPLGSECAGRVTAVGAGVDHLRAGDEVVAVARGSFARFVTTDAGLVARRPAHLSLQEAVTIPIAFLTAHFALQHLARLKAGDRVLIHAAAGGVGMAAVQIAQRAGAVVFATAGTPEKRRLLQDMGVRHVMSSRTPEFASAILEETGGAGVDVVLNSLSGELLERTFAVAATGARFLEIGKNGIWSAERVAGLHKGISYFTIDWGVDAASSPSLIEGMFRDLLQGFGLRGFAPLPARVFPLAAVADAFRHMAQGRHTGKVLVAHDTQPPLETPALPVRAGATYLVTGGLSGLGLLTAQWLVERGATHLALVGRRGTPEESQEALRDLERAGATVLACRADVSVEADVKRIIADIGRVMPPIRGVVHSAGVLDDGALVQQEWSRFESVLAPKVRGAWNLHRQLQGCPLDFFVLYSSLASVLGSAGQGNHASANAFLDALARCRRGDGLPALSINWGAWSGVGAAARLGVADRADGRGIGAITPAEGIEALGRLMRDGSVQTAVSPIEWRTFLRHCGPNVSPLLSRIAAEAPQDTRAVPAAVETATLVQQLAEAPAGSRFKILHGHIRERAARVLGAAGADGVDVRRPLNEQGLDSLMAVELRNVLGVSVGTTLSATLLFDYPTVDSVAAHLATMLDVGERLAARTDAAPVSVLDQISDLSDDDVDRLFAERLGGRH